MTEDYKNKVQQEVFGLFSKEDLQFSLRTFGEVKYGFDGSPSKLGDETKPEEPKFQLLERNYIDVKYVNQ